ncbi:DMT family transporter [Aquabacter sp. L1I39]|uniref:DMT family transporter n=1 Tax=Aquabacter sp. L1I39 TaxID=2820278 RepID=UPI001AD9E0CF|nr:DMT family transporter [Aquabacter sp. L1I39]QTL01799.1 DMT family transporter [Aquabacter sp. L1I39]
MSVPAPKSVAPASAGSSVPLGLLLGFIGVCLFGVTVPATRYAVHWLDPAFLTFARATLAGVLGVAILVMRGARWPHTRGARMRDIVVVAGCLVFGFPLLMAYGSLTVPSSHAGVVLAILPLMTTLGAMLVAGERPTLTFLAISALGCGLVMAFAFRNGAAGSLGAGDSLLALAAIICAFGYAVSGRLSRHMPGWEVICWVVAVSLVVTVPGMFLTAPYGHFDAVPLSAWVALIYVGAVSQFFAFFFWNKGMALGGIARVGQVQLMQTFLIVVFSWPINGEAPDLETYLFMGLVIAVVALGQKAKVKGTAPG